MNNRVADIIAPFACNLRCTIMYFIGVLLSLLLLGQIKGEICDYAVDEGTIGEILDSLKSNKQYEPSFSTEDIRKSNFVKKEKVAKFFSDSLRDYVIKGIGKLDDKCIIITFNFDDKGTEYGQEENYELIKKKAFEYIKDIEKKLNIKIFRSKSEEKDVKEYKGYTVEESLKNQRNEQIHSEQQIQTETLEEKDKIQKTEEFEKDSLLQKRYQEVRNNENVNKNIESDKKKEEARELYEKQGYRREKYEPLEEGKNKKNKDYEFDEEINKKLKREIKYDINKSGETKYNNILLKNEKSNIVDYSNIKSTENQIQFENPYYKNDIGFVNLNLKNVPQSPPKLLNPYEKKDSYISNYIYSANALKNNYIDNKYNFKPAITESYVPKLNLKPVTIEPPKKDLKPIIPIEPIVVSENYKEELKNAEIKEKEYYNNYKDTYMKVFMDVLKKLENEPALETVKTPEITPSLLKEEYPYKAPIAKLPIVKEENSLQISKEVENALKTFDKVALEEESQKYKTNHEKDNNNLGAILKQENYEIGKEIRGNEVKSQEIEKLDNIKKTAIEKEILNDEIIKEKNTVFKKENIENNFKESKENGKDINSFKSFGIQDEFKKDTRTDKIESEKNYLDKKFEESKISELENSKIKQEESINQFTELQEESNLSSNNIIEDKSVGSVEDDNIFDEVYEEDLITDLSKDIQLENESLGNTYNNDEIDDETSNDYLKDDEYYKDEENLLEGKTENESEIYKKNKFDESDYKTSQNKGVIKKIDSYLKTKSIGNIELNQNNNLFEHYDSSLGKKSIQNSDIYEDDVNLDEINVPNAYGYYKEVTPIKSSDSKYEKAKSNYNIVEFEIEPYYDDDCDLNYDDSKSGQYSNESRENSETEYQRLYKSIKNEIERVKRAHYEIQSSYEILNKLFEEICNAPCENLKY